MPRPTKVVINATTKEVSIVALTDEEITAQAILDAEFLANVEARSIEQARIDGLKESARAKLAAGEPLSAEEAELMIP